MTNDISSIRAILTKAKWSQTRLARELGVSFITVNRWVNGHASPQPTQRKAVERLYRALVGIEPVAKGDLQNVLREVAARKKKFPGAAKYLRQDQIIEEFLLELTYHSDAIEGSTFTRKETEAVIFDKAVIKGKSLTEHIEAANHAAILRDIFGGKIRAPVTEETILALHKALMQGIREDAGRYAQTQRGIRGVELALPAPEDIPEEMGRLCRELNVFRGEPIAHIARMHADFEAIHPFGDGNGRVGRLVMIIQSLNHGLAPCVITVNRKAQYYEALEYAQKKSPTHLVRFLAEAVLAGYAIIGKYSRK